MAIAMLVGALLNVIEHDEEVLIPLIVFGILMMFACGHRNNLLKNGMERYHEVYNIR